MIKLRIDVDYPYPSRAKNILQVALRSKRQGRDYLKNACIIARMINESPKDVKAYWFFTPYTIPDKSFLVMLNPERHEVALHLVTKPIEELKNLESKTGRTIKYYTIHGTEGGFARWLWQRKSKGPQVDIPSGYRLKPLDEGNITFSIDRERYKYGYEKAMKLVKDELSFFS